MSLLRSLSFLALWLLTLAQANADEFKPALLEITQTSPEWYSVTWKTPLRNGMRLPLQPELAALEQVGPVSTRQIANSLVEKSTWRGEPDALVGSTVSVTGISSLQIDVVVQVKLLDGTVTIRRDGPFVIDIEAAMRWAVAQGIMAPAKFRH